MPDNTVPDWVDETPKEYEYELHMVDYVETCSSLQSIKMTREEYIALKGFLAEMRGYAPNQGGGSELTLRSIP